MFLGQYEHTIDEKGRLTVPVRYRDLLQEGAYITTGFDRNLMVLTASHFDRMSVRVNQMNLMDPTARQLKRFIFSNADRLEIDKAGRVLIPQYLRDSAHLNIDVIVAGVGDYLEIWSSELWGQQIDTLSDIDANAQRFAALDLSL